MYNMFVSYRPHSRFPADENYQTSHPDGDNEKKGFPVDITSTNTLREERKGVWEEPALNNLSGSLPILHYY